MSHDEEHGEHRADTREKLIRMANQIGTFFKSKPHEEGVAGVAEHINKFWEPRMRRQFFEIVDGGGEGLLPIVMEAVGKVRRPDDAEAPEQARQAHAGSPNGKGVAAG